MDLLTKLWHGELDSHFHRPVLSGDTPFRPDTHRTRVKDAVIELASASSVGPARMDRTHLT